MKKKVIIFTLCIMANTILPSCQEKETYWKIFNIYKEDNELLTGFSNIVFMMGFWNSNFHFRKNGDTIHIDFPEGQVIRIDTLRSLTNKYYPEDYFDEKYRGKLRDSIFFIGVERGKFKIKFINSLVTEDDKRTIIQFYEMSEAEYFTSLHQVDSLLKEQKQIISRAIQDWSTQSIKTEEKEFEIFDRQFKVQLPTEYDIVYKGTLYSHRFDNLKVGVHTDNELEQEDYFYVSKSEEPKFLEPTIIFAVAPENLLYFDRYIKEFSSEKILYKTDSCFVAVDFICNPETNETELSSITFFKHFYRQGTHIIFSNNLAGDNLLDLSIAKEQFLIMQSLSVE